MTAEHLTSTQPSWKYILHPKNSPLFQLISCPNHMPSLLHLYAFVYTTALFANMANHLFSKPLEQFMPSQQYPGLMLNLFEGGSGPLYTGFSVKRYVKAWQTIDHTIYFSKSAKKIIILDATWFRPSELQIKGTKVSDSYQVLFFLYSIDGFTNHVWLELYAWFWLTEAKPNPKCMCYNKSKPEQSICHWNHRELKVTYMWSYWYFKGEVCSINHIIVITMMKNCKWNLCSNCKMKFQKEATLRT